LATYGRYSSVALKEGAKSLACTISGQDLYCPQPHQGAIYKAYKTAYRTTVRAHPEKMKVSISPNVTDDVKEAANAFFDSFEGLERGEG